jgi:hypothetical protein
MRILGPIVLPSPALMQVLDAEIARRMDRWRSQCAPMRSVAVCSPSCAMLRFDAIDARQRLYGLVPMPMVSLWQRMRSKISRSGLGGPAVVERGSIRARHLATSTFSNRVVDSMQVNMKSPRAGNRAGARWPASAGRQDISGTRFPAHDEPVANLLTAPLDLRFYRLVG